MHDVRIVECRRTNELTGIEPISVVSSSNQDETRELYLKSERKGEEY